jgi:hypothetical protein
VSAPSGHTIDLEEENHYSIAKKLMLDIILAFLLLHLLMVLVIQAITALKVQPLPCRFLAQPVASDQLRMEVSLRIAQSVHREAIARHKDSVCRCHAQLVFTVP